MQEFNIEHHMRSSEQYKQLETLFQKLNNGYLMTPEGASGEIVAKRNSIRTYLYNLFHSPIDGPLSEDEEPEVNRRSLPTRPSSEGNLGY